MSEHDATIEWTRGDQPFIDNRYSRAHDWRFDGGAVVRDPRRRQRAPADVGPPAVDPEEALVAALSSCHMLFFLAFAAKAGLVVDRYCDRGFGRPRPGRGRSRLMTEVTLRPVTPSRAASPTRPNSTPAP